jgi:hypothetical protein
MIISDEINIVQNFIFFYFYYYFYFIFYIIIFLLYISPRLSAAAAAFLYNIELAVGKMYDYKNQKIDQAKIKNNNFYFLNKTQFNHKS